MFHHKPQRLFAGLDKIDAVLVARCVDANFAAVGLEFIHLLAEDVEDAHHAKVFTHEGHAFVGGVGEEVDGSCVVIDGPGFFKHHNKGGIGQVTCQGDNIRHDALGNDISYNT